MIIPESWFAGKGKGHEMMKNWSLQINALFVFQLDGFYFSKSTAIERWLSVQKHLLFFQRTSVQFPAPLLQLITIFNTSIKYFSARLWS